MALLTVTIEVPPTDQDMTPIQAHHAVDRAITLLDHVGQVYPPFDDLVSSAYNDLDDALSTVKSLIPEGAL